MLSFYKKPDKYIVLSSLQIIYLILNKSAKKLQLKIYPINKGFGNVMVKKQKLKIFNNYIKTPDIYV